MTKLVFIKGYEKLEYIANRIETTKYPVEGVRPVTEPLPPIDYRNIPYYIPDVYSIYFEFYVDSSERHLPQWGRVWNYLIIENIIYTDVVCWHPEILWDEFIGSDSVSAKVRIQAVYRPDMLVFLE